MDALYDMIIRELRTAPESQISENLRNECTVFYSTNKTEAEKYDFLSGISKYPLTEISSFVRELCAVDKHYKRPSQ